MGAGYKNILWNIAPSLAAAVFGVIFLIGDALDPGIDWRPVAVIGTIYTLCLAAVAISPTYLMPGLAPLSVLAGVALDRSRSNALRIVFILLLLGLAVGPYRQMNELKNYDAVLRQDVRWLSSTDTSSLIADGGHIFSYYLQRPIAELTVAYGRQALTLRERGVYHPLTQASVRGHLLLILKQHSGFFGPGGGEELLRDCRRTDRMTFVVYDCREDNRRENNH